MFFNQNSDRFPMKIEGLKEGIDYDLYYYGRLGIKRVVGYGPDEINEVVSEEKKVRKWFFFRKTIPAQIETREAWPDEQTEPILHNIGTLYLTNDFVSRRYKIIKEEAKLDLDRYWIMEVRSKEDLEYATEFVEALGDSIPSVTIELRLNYNYRRKSKEESDE